VVLAAAGFDAWVALTTVDQNDVLCAPHGRVTDAELREVQSWLRVGAHERLKRLSTGTWALRSTHTRQDRRLVLGLRRRPHVYELELGH
jgi:hypothetical protein